MTTPVKVKYKHLGKFTRIALAFLLTLPVCSYSAETGGTLPVPLKGVVLKMDERPVSESAQWRKPRRVALRLFSSLQAYDEKTLQSIRKILGGAELIVVNDTAALEGIASSIDVLLGSCSEVTGAMTQLRWVQNFSAGVERCVDLPAFKKDGVLLTNMKGVFGPSISEHVIALMLTLTRRLYQYQIMQHENGWSAARYSPMSLHEIKGKTMLVVGLGGIGTEVARLASALGMQVIATRNSSREGPDFVDYIGLSDELMSLVEKADVIVNTVPLTPRTQGLFERTFFKTMKNTAYFINIGRGKSVITQDLIDALKNNELAGAGLDVVEPEPLPQESELWNMPNVIITPHISGRSDLVRNRHKALIMENLRRYVNGERMLNVVDIKKGY